MSEPGQLPSRDEIVEMLARSIEFLDKAIDDLADRMREIEEFYDSSSFTLVWRDFIRARSRRKAFVSTWEFVTGEIWRPRS